MGGCIGALLSLTHLYAPVIAELPGQSVDADRFSRELIDHISAHLSVDMSRIYATGMSGGGRMSSRLACDLSDVIAAIRPVAGIRYPEDCNPTRPVPVITFHTNILSPV